jgi:hypothetical protein
VEDLISTWDLMDIKPSRGRYTWTNKRVGPGHIAARLDRFLVQSSFLTLGLTTSSEILPNSTSDHKPITLEIKKEQGQGPIPFRFNPLGYRTRTSEAKSPRFGPAKLKDLHFMSGKKS